ncbi:hypothetical protein GJ496_011243 [Pomphorhynchus laevis]|nr:hypothetical protein GJ496_011243 [Pomphorhynchus laevis]
MLDEQVISTNQTDLNQGGDEDKDVYYDATEEFTMLFHSVCLANRTEDISPKSCVFLDKSKALQLARTHSCNRFKTLKSYTEAINFAADADSVNILKMSKSIDIPKCQFSSPSQVLINKFASALKENDLNSVNALIEENPCYLINDLDAPVIMKISTRHYASHMCAQFNCSDVLKVILNTIVDPEFIRKIHPKDTDEQIHMCCNRLLDLYLNSPDKILNETPLHIACKLGNKHIIELLVTYPELKLNATNRNGCRPQQLIPKRGSNGFTYQELDDALNGNYFVPILEKEEHGPGCVGKPCDSSLLFSPKQSPVRAVAGPMTIKKADTLVSKYHTWRRSLQHRGDDDDVRSDINKGAEILFRKFTKELNVKFGEQWPFFKGFVELSSPDGLQLFEYFLRQKYICEHYPQHMELFRIDDCKVLSDHFKSLMNLLRSDGIENIDSNIKNIICELSLYDNVIPSLFSIPVDSSYSLVERIRRLSIINSASSANESTDILYNASLFLQGNQFTKLDRDVYKAIKEVEIYDCYPFLKAWKALVSDYLAQNSAHNYSIC